MHPYRADIDGLRAIAVLAVVGFHVNSGLVPGGFVGVDVFFVISGYLISNIIYRELSQNTFSFGAFYLRRIRRILPALILVLCATWAIGWYILAPEEYLSLGKHIAASAAFLPNVLLWNEAGYFDTAAESKPLLHLWSLGIEEQFYLLWPLLIFLFWRSRARTFTLVILLTGISLLLNILLVASHPILTFYLPPTRFWELLLGGILAYVEQYKRHWLSRNSMLVRHIYAYVGLFMIVGSLYLVDKAKPYPGAWALLPTIGTILLIVAGSDVFVNRYILGNRALVYVGLISYPLYLWHWPLLNYARILDFGDHQYVVIVVSVALSFVLAWVTYIFIERLFRVRRESHQAFYRYGPSFLVISLVGVGILGFVTLKSDGFTSRLPRELRGFNPIAYANLWKEYRLHSCFLDVGRNQGEKDFEVACPDAKRTRNEQAGRAYLGRFVGCRIISRIEGDGI